MQILSKAALAATIMIISSCSLFNDREVDLAINSAPSGANIFIEGRNYGTTPKIIKIEPKPYEIILTKEKYGSTSFRTEIWFGKGRRDVDGKITGDGKRCLTDFVSATFWFLNSSKCGDFKQKQYFVMIPYSDKDGGYEVRISKAALIRKPVDLIDYYRSNTSKENLDNQN